MLGGEGLLLVALQSPVAGDLRFVVMRVHAAEKLARMGDPARHVAEQVRRAHPDSAVPADTRERFAEMGRLAVVAAHNVRQMIAEPGQTRYAELEEADDLIDIIEQCLLASVSSRDWEHGVRAGICVALLARFYERFGDQAVSIVRRLDDVVTGALPSQSSAVETGPAGVLHGSKEQVSVMRTPGSDPAEGARGRTAWQPTA
jgi:phosphate transport system protein